MSFAKLRTWGHETHCGSSRTLQPDPPGYFSDNRQSGTDPCDRSGLNRAKRWPLCRRHITPEPSSRPMMRAPQPVSHTDLQRQCSRILHIPLLALGLFACGGGELTSAVVPEEAADGGMKSAARPARASEPRAPSRDAGATQTGRPALDAEVEHTSERTDAGATSVVEEDAGGQEDSAPVVKNWVPSRPRKLGMLVGFDAKYATPNVSLFGSDRASSFEHAGKIVVLFGDSYGQPDSTCGTMFGENDDMAGTLPLNRVEQMPKLAPVTEPSAPEQFRRVQLFRDGASVLLDQFKFPMTGFSDGTAAYAVFQPQIPVSCGGEPAQACPERDGLLCVPSLSFCSPSPITTPAVCEAGAPLCLLGSCRRSSACVDTRSSQYDGSPRGNAASVLSEVYIARARDEDLASYDVVATWQTNFFAQATARTVSRFTGSSADADYNHGHGALFVWGRPGWMAEQGRQARLYFATAALPLAGGVFRPRYYAGSDEQSSEPIWTENQARAVPLAMDGMANGNASEEQGIINTTTVSYLPAPINQWVMMYGGDLPPHLLADAMGTRATPRTGSIVMRFAKQPWGPWSAPIEHLSAGSPTKVGEAYGPGGLMFHRDCMDVEKADCARSDPYALQLTGQCAMRASTDQGRLYAPGIIDAYTRRNAQGGLDITWTISTWNPYATYLMETSFDPG